MPRNVEIAAGKYNVTLPNGRLYNAGDEVVLTDDEWGDVDPNLVPGTIIDNGATEVGGGGGTTDGLTDAQLRATAVPVSMAATAGPTTGTNTSVANAITVQTVLAANANRKGATIFNDDTLTTGATLKIKLGSGASAIDFTYAIPAQGYFEVPYGYTGIITGIASAATGNARVTELT